MSPTPAPIAALRLPSSSPSEAPRAHDHRHRQSTSSSPGGPAPRTRRGRDLGAAALILLALIWGYNWVVMKIGLEYAQPFTFAALRTFLGALSLFLLLIVLRRSLRPPTLGFTIVIGLLQTTGFVGLLMWALQSGGAGKTSVLDLHHAVLAAAAGVDVPRRTAARPAVAGRRSRVRRPRAGARARGSCRAR